MQAVKCFLAELFGWRSLHHRHEVEYRPRMSYWGSFMGGAIVSYVCRRCGKKWKERL